MERRERVFDLEETLITAFEALVSGVWTALPGLFQWFTNSYNTCEVQCPVNGRARQPNGTYKSIQMPKFVDVQIVWCGGGGATWTFPLKAGIDEGLIVFSSRCIDKWWKYGFQPPTGLLDAAGNPFNPANDPPEFRMHNLSDGFFIPGVRSQPRAFASFDVSTARLRTDDDTCYLEFDPVNKKVNIVAGGGVTINTATIDSSGNVTSPGTVTGQTEVVSKTGGSAVHLSTHVHPGNNQPPTPGS